jgi:hypothetical protein
MISACSSASSLGAQAPTQQTQTAATSKTPQASRQEDTVHLSPAAKAATSGDVDHDGDSH